MRIASAPDSYRAWPPCGTTLVPPSRVQRLGTSDPQLNLLPSPPSTSLHVSWGTQTQDVRRRLHYHLANIFPEEQVQAVMALHPHETDPQQICAAILAMFPKNQNWRDYEFYTECSRIENFERRRDLVV